MKFLQTQYKKVVIKKIAKKLSRYHICINDMTQNELDYMIRYESGIVSSNTKILAINVAIIVLIGMWSYVFNNINN